MKITYYGQNSLFIEVAGKTIMVDPFISGNENLKGIITAEDIKVDYILLTHAHQDHVLDVETIAKNNEETVIVSNAEIASYYGEKGFKAHGMNHGGSWEFDFGKVKYVIAHHSSTFPDGASGGLPGGFVMQAGGKTVYIAGDTSLTMDMKLIPMFFTLDLAILPIGDNYTMGPDEAVVAAEFVECDKILGCHYDTFGLIEIDHSKALETFKAKNKELLLLDLGASIEV
ncbi:L-ascorbate metabolism protein UlaG, beta-lactamase superfamily [Pustulibacterium marinum]|uniref:L-ascorbate metabolism protein UlaG, beta-lactamase superfamily n=1 Tax=Pustulibacterium marinum TaxID=1224947 RepID=A0A1I7GDI1_9FLAO|nr:metal-dependent hydrolase [Pustulibacterium marinum]SFU46316.1 L-ascorbate metabolism protein UlaG, beta-lactamase superfamily [Pustulibacterium marinum]